MTTFSSDSPRGGLGWRTGVALGIFAFLAGIGAMALIARNADRWADRWGFGAKPATTLTLPVGANGKQTPVLIVPARETAALPAIDLAALSSREAELNARIADLEARAGGIDTSARNAAGYATRAEGLMVAFAVRRALDRGLGLGYLEGQLHTRFDPSQPRAVATIVQAAHEPVTIEDLRGGLEGIAPALVTDGANGGWVASLRRELGSLVLLHRAGTPSPLPIDRVARARRLLEAGQVEAALAEVARTPGAAQAAGWTSAARRYVAARRAIDVIETAAIGVPTPAPVPTPTTAPPRDVPGMGATPPNR